MTAMMMRVEFTVNNRTVECYDKVGVWRKVIVSVERSG